MITKKGLPEVCEYCGSKLEWDSVNLICTNPNCSHKHDENLKAWIMNLAPVEGIGWKTIEKVINMPYYSDCNITIKTVTNGDLPEIPGVEFGHGEQGGWNEILFNLRNSSFTISQFLLALNIPGLGKKGALAFEEYPNCIDILDNIAEHKALASVDDFYAMAKCFQDKYIAGLLCGEYYNHFKLCYDLVRSRLIYTVTLNKEKPVIGEVVITGKLSMKRNDFEQLLKENGFILKNAVNKNTLYLITDDPDSGTGKNKKADELGVTKITEADFRAKYMF